MRSPADEIKRRDHERSASGKADWKELADIEKTVRMISLIKDARSLVVGCSPNCVP